MRENDRPQWNFNVSKPKKLSEELFLAFAELVYQHTGIRFHPESRFILERRLLQRMRALGIPEFDRYYYYLQYHPEKEAELERLIDVVTTHETYFFREKRQLECFREEILPLLIAEKQKESLKTLRIWSAGCSTGEEPYTIAMILDEIPQLAEWNVFIFASDISSWALKVAREGVYGRSSFRDIDERYLKKYFKPVGNDRFKIDDCIREKVMFGKVNILDTSKLILFGMLDVIFCRNVLIYFDATAKKKAVQNLYERLRPGGFLLLGHSESLLGIDARLKLVHFKHDLVYQK